MRAIIFMYLHTHFVCFVRRTEALVKRTDTIYVQNLVGKNISYKEAMRMKVSSNKRKTLIRGADPLKRGRVGPSFELLLLLLNSITIYFSEFIVTFVENEPKEIDCKGCI